VNSFYITTAIPYVNAAPHLGHALELVQADVLARHRRLRGQPVRFLTGTDDNALKNVTAAAAGGVDVAEFVAAGGDRFAGLLGPLSLSCDDTIRTSSDPRHRPGVEALWRRTAAAGDFYRRRYEGRYCAGCERFADPGELSCAEHGVELQTVAEENWFFRLSRYADVVEEAIRTGRLRIEPPSRRNEVLGFLRGGVEDISVSRPAARAGGWGIPVPDDPEQVVYVWWDALANYVTALGYGSGGAAYPAWWEGDGRRVHVIGKGILRFHAMIWPALLASAGLPLPTELFVHPYLGVDGAKISKSAGTSVDPLALVERFGVDALRWWLVREVGLDADTDFTTARLVDRANRELAGGIGNLANRTVALVHRYRDGTVLAGASTLAAGLPARIDAALELFDLRRATDAIRDAVDRGNRFVERERPWELARDPAAAGRLDAALAELVGLCRTLAVECGPFVPDGAARLRAGLGADARVGAVRPAFSRAELTQPAPGRDGG
jgi:methionyl-tRNA synthetase